MSETRSGAHNIDSECTGTSLRDFLRASDLTPMSEDAVELYDRESVARWSFGLQTVVWSKRILSARASVPLASASEPLA